MVSDFVLSTLSSLGRFSTERELRLHGTLRNCFRHAELIWNEDAIAAADTMGTAPNPFPPTNDRTIPKQFVSVMQQDR